MRQAYVNKGVDRTALIEYATYRSGEETEVHDHPRSEPCANHHHFVVKGRK